MKGRTEQLVTAVVLLGAGALVAGTLGTDLGRIDPVVLGLLAVLAAGSQRVPVLLFQNAGISVSFAAAVAAFVLYGVGPGIWVNLVAAAVSAFSPKRKPLRKALFNAGNLALTAFLAGHAYQLVGGSVPPNDLVRALFGGAVAASVHFAVGTFLVSCAIASSTGSRVLAVWRENYSWTTVNSIAVALNGVAIALATQTIGPAAAAAFVLPLAAAWSTYRIYVDRSREVRTRNERLAGENELLASLNEQLRASSAKVLAALGVQTEGASPVDDRVIDELGAALRAGGHLDSATIDKVVALLAESARPAIAASAQPQITVAIPVPRHN